MSSAHTKDSVPSVKLGKDVMDSLERCIRVQEEKMAGHVKIKKECVSQITLSIGKVESKRDKQLQRDKINGVNNR
jgi:ABC-type histidine transport system ATPase subunit